MQHLYVLAERFETQHMKELMCCFILLRVVAEIVSRCVFEHKHLVVGWSSNIFAFLSRKNNKPHSDS